MNKNTVVTPEFVVQSSEVITDDTRQEEYNMIVLPVDLMTDDYVDILIKELQSIALPRYNVNNRAVIPPRVAVRFGNELFISGVVTSTISCVYNKPILSNGKYAKVTISFAVSEYDPYDATSVSQLGSFRGITSANNIFSSAS